MIRQGLRFTKYPRAKLGDYERELLVWEGPGGANPATLSRLRLSMRIGRGRAICDEKGLEASRAPPPGDVLPLTAHAAIYVAANCQWYDSPAIA